MAIRPKLKPYGKFMQAVPCGSCPSCRRTKQAQWAFRLKNELNNAISATFVTLTYEAAPLTNCGARTLRKKDVQDYHKRVRKELEKGYSDRPYKYYLVGEYGSTTHRPHYHEIAYNLPHSIDAQWLADRWQHGHVHVDTVNPAVIGYVTKYLFKKTEMSDTDPRLPEFNLMSKGLGKNYLTPQMVKYHQNNIPLHVQDFDVKIALPRYYKDKIHTGATRYQYTQKATTLLTEIEAERNWRDHAYAVKAEYRNFDKLQNTKRNTI